jgi:hypothetical protein
MDDHSRQKVHPHNVQSDNSIVFVKEKVVNSPKKSEYCHPEQIS